ncbi:LysM peptidoglycan-binding domain-containing protein [Oceanobacillus senegalensis]|uniref:LysM peptidoglycan-binding domain-containing protein n=1 Tax=Oceanobacillus senegalensis TaxID=1936063 RepID=UPI000A30CFB2|nr:LysM peptidoglycan-binding domain-containing protein [Oceanobacillus senegalensis]
MKTRRSCILLVIIILLLPVSPIQALESTPPNLYKVKSEDTLPSIAKKYGTTVENLKITNGLQFDTLVEGQQLWVPSIQEVKAGESLENLALLHHSTSELIKKTNNLSSEQLHPGLILKINPKKMKMDGQHILMTKEEFRDWLINHAFTREIHVIQQHHTWKPSYRNFLGDNHFQMLKSMQNHHMNQMGWSNIAQNITTFPDGKIAVSRPLNIAPEGSIGPKANKHGIAIEHIGNFDIGEDVMTKEQRDTIVYITALLSIKFELNPSIDTITYHHWWHYKTKKRVFDNAKSNEVKSCPGSNFFGGNSTESARKYFYPLVKEKIKEIRASMK